MKREISKKTVITLPETPYIHPGVPQGALSPAQAYLAGREARKAGNAPPKANVPVAGGRAPLIPRLDQPYQEGMTMEQQARLTREPEAPQSMGIVESPVRPSLQLMHTDILPPEAREDPAFITGQGDMFASNQSNMAVKYGVIRNHQRIPPQVLIGGHVIQAGQQRQLRPETLRDIQALQALQKAQEAETPNVVGSNAEAEKKVPEGVRAAGDIGNLPEPRDQAKDTEILADTISKMDEFEFDSWRRAMMKDILNNPGQKDIIEARLKPMDVGDLVTQNYIIQRVPIILGKFEPSFRTTDGETDLALKRLIMEDSKSIEMSDRYYLDKFTMMSMAALLFAINGKAYPDHVNTQGNFDDEMFKKKFAQIIKLPLPMLASLGVNALWFDIRVRKLFVVEKVSNG